MLRQPAGPVPPQLSLSPAPAEVTVGPGRPRPERQEGSHRPERAEWPGGFREAESRVAAPAAQGHTDRQISSKLLITVSTVEQHLTRIYRKVHVTQRADLATRLASVATLGK